MICVYDIESFKDIFCIVFLDIKTEKLYRFEISSRKNEIKELYSFLKKLKGLIGYNVLNFDYPLLHFIIKNYKILSNLNGHTCCSILRNKTNEIINANYSRIPEKQVLIPQLDLYLIHHYDNNARACSLKWLEFSLRWNKVQDLPYDPDDDLTDDMKEEVIIYCYNDVKFTHNLYLNSKKAISFRNRMSKKLNHNVDNYSDVKIGEYINQITYEKLSGRKYYDFKYQRTLHDEYKMSDIIPDIIKFKTPYLQNFLKELRKKKFYNSEDDNKEDKNIDQILHFAGVHIKFAKGGLHTEDKPRIVNCKKGWKLKEKDIGSMYPWTIICDDVYPAHLGKEWKEGIKNSYNIRLFELKPKLKKLPYKSPEWEDVDSDQAVYKLSMNGGGFGKLGSKYSWQCDTLQKYRVTIGGELKLLMLIEDLHLVGAEIISVNTDGVVVHYPKEMEQTIQQVHKDWEELTTYILEDTSYSRIIFNSVNDYIAEIIDEDTEKVIKLKFKGDFEIDKEWHKNNSKRIVPIALKRFFIDGIPVEETIKNHLESKDYDNIKNYGILDFCLGVKSAKNQKYLLINNGIKVIKDKVIRYFISTNGNKLYKEYIEKTVVTNKLSIFNNECIEEKKTEAVNKGYLVTIFQEISEFDYNIDYNFYISECKKIIDPILKTTKEFKDKNIIKKTQLNLF